MSEAETLPVWSMKMFEFLLFVRTYKASVNLLYTLYKITFGQRSFQGLFYLLGSASLAPPFCHLTNTKPIGDAALTLLIV